MTDILTDRPKQGDRGAIMHSEKVLISSQSLQHLVRELALLIRLV